MDLATALVVMPVASRLLVCGGYVRGDRAGSEPIY